MLSGSSRTLHTNDHEVKVDDLFGLVATDDGGLCLLLVNSCHHRDPLENAPFRVRFTRRLVRKASSLQIVSFTI